MILRGWVAECSTQVFFCLPDTRHLASKPLKTRFLKTKKFFFRNFCTRPPKIAPHQQFEQNFSEFWIFPPTRNGARGLAHTRKFLFSVHLSGIWATSIWETWKKRNWGWKKFFFCFLPFGQLSYCARHTLRYEKKADKKRLQGGLISCIRTTQKMPNREVSLFAYEFFRGARKSEPDSLCFALPWLEMHTKHLLKCAVANWMNFATQTKQMVSRPWHKMDGKREFAVVCAAKSKPLKLHRGRGRLKCFGDEAKAKN